MEVKDILKTVDHTNLVQTATWEEIRQLCDEAMHYGTASVCIPPYYVKEAKEYVGDRLAIGTVVGFPNGYCLTAVKLFEAEQAVRDGADEVDMVINISMLKNGRLDELAREIADIKKAVGNKVLKVIIETCLLTEEEKITMCGIVSEAGADYIKTSTGFSKAGATFEDVALFKAHVSPSVKIKAAGGITSLEDAERFITLGADRLGTSRIVKILQQQESEGY